MPEQDNQIRITVRVQPQASRDEIVGFSGDVLKVKLTAPPVEGKANRRLVEFLSKYLGISKSSVSIVKGEASKTKVVLIEGQGREEILKKLSSL